MKKMKLLSLAVMIFASIITVSANDGEGMLESLPISNASMVRNGSLMTVAMDMELGSMEMKGDKAVIFTPVIYNGSDTLALESVGLFGRTRWYQYERRGSLMPEGVEGTAMRFSERPSVLKYNQNVPYEEWMNGAQLKVDCSTYGCCRDLKGFDYVALGCEYKEFEPYQPVFTYMSETAAGVKTRELSGRAYIDFPVNQTVIYPNFRNNPVELGKIIATIDSVKNDKDITVTSIWIKGTASPEGSYANNVRLAKGRTESLKDYVNNLYHFPYGFIRSTYEPVDWEGLAEYLEKSPMEFAPDILAIVKSNLEPYARNQRIKLDFPKEYRFLLDNVYPSLRHSDYKIEYEIRTFTDVKEIAVLLKTQPQKLSLNELNLLAQSYEPGSDEYNEVFETAVRMFPESEVANVNAANAAMQRGDIYSAKHYLSKGGFSPEARYARANLMLLEGNQTGALKAFEELQEFIPQAKTAVKELKLRGVGE